MRSQIGAEAEYSQEVEANSASVFNPHLFEWSRASETTLLHFVLLSEARLGLRANSFVRHLGAEFSAAFPPLESFVAFRSLGPSFRGATKSRRIVSDSIWWGIMMEELLSEGLGLGRARSAMWCYGMRDRGKSGNGTLNHRLELRDFPMTKVIGVNLQYVQVLPSLFTQHPAPANPLTPPSAT
jgi:hypothetical protein